LSLGSALDIGFLQHATRLGARRLRQLAAGLGVDGFGGLPLGSTLDGYNSLTLARARRLRQHADRLGACWLRQLASLFDTRLLCQLPDL
jgi:hypothetical protein